MTVIGIIMMIRMFLKRNFQSSRVIKKCEDRFSVRHLKKRGKLISHLVKNNTPFNVFFSSLVVTCFISHSGLSFLVYVCVCVCVCVGGGVSPVFLCFPKYFSSPGAWDLICWLAEVVDHVFPTQATETPPGEGGFRQTSQ